MNNPGLNIKSSPAVLTMPSLISGLGIARSMGQRGIHTICADQNQTCATQSKYSEYLQLPDWKSPENEEKTLLLLEKRAQQESHKPIFFPCGDEAVLFLSRHRDRLANSFRFNITDHDLLTKLINKVSLFQLAKQHGLPTPLCVLPKTVEEAEYYTAQMTYPCLLKTVYSHSPLVAAGSGFTLVHDQYELLYHFSRLHVIDPNLMITEFIPGPDRNVHIYAAYWDQAGKPNMVFTGRKERQDPWVCSIMCSSTNNPEVTELMNVFCKKINFYGIIDADMKYDERDGLYKILDFNPRIGQNFRTFLTTDDIDLPYAQYCDLNGSPVTFYVPRIGRYWIVEDHDFTKSLKNVLLRRLTVADWLSPYRKVEELTYFSLHDLKPCLFHIWQKICGFPAWLTSPTAAPAQILQKLKQLFPDKNSAR